MRMSEWKKSAKIGSSRQQSWHKSVKKRIKIPPNQKKRNYFSIIPLGLDGDLGVGRSKVDCFILCDLFAYIGVMRYAESDPNKSETHLFDCSHL